MAAKATGSKEKESTKGDPAEDRLEQLSELKPKAKKVRFLHNITTVIGRFQTVSFKEGDYVPEDKLLRKSLLKAGAEWA